MKELDIKNPNGYLMDANGNVCIKFGNWEIGTHMVPDFVESVEYVDGPSSHNVDVDQDYIREV